MLTQKELEKLVVSYINMTRKINRCNRILYRNPERMKPDVFYSSIDEYQSALKKHQRLMYWNRVVSDIKTDYTSARYEVSTNIRKIIGSYNWVKVMDGCVIGYNGNDICLMKERPNNSYPSLRESPYIGDYFNED